MGSQPRRQARFPARRGSPSSARGGRARLKSLLPRVPVPGKEKGVGSWNVFSVGDRVSTRCVPGPVALILGLLSGWGLVGSQALRACQTLFQASPWVLLLLSL